MAHDSGSDRMLAVCQGYGRWPISGGVGAHTGHKIPSNVINQPPTLAARDGV